MFRRNSYLIQTVLYLFAVLNVNLRQLCHSNDCIHRCPYIMGHVGQEHAFRCIGMFGCGNRGI